MRRCASTALAQRAAEVVVLVETLRGGQHGRAVTTREGIVDERHQRWTVVQPNGVAPPRVTQPVVRGVEPRSGRSAGKDLFRASDTRSAAQPEGLLHSHTCERGRYVVLL